MVKPECKTAARAGEEEAYRLMDRQLQHALALRATDVEGAIKRFNGDESLYVTCLKMFLDDPTIQQLNQAIASEAWDDAFTAAHALKGLAGNMGFVPLMHATSQLLITIRGGRTREVGEYMAQVNSDYRDITDAIHGSFFTKEAEGEII